MTLSNEWVYEPITVTNEQPDPSWSREKMVAYMREKYGDPSKLKDVRTGCVLSWEEVVKAWDNPEPKT